jgi:hypothetical protein
MSITRGGGGVSDERDRAILEAWATGDDETFVRELSLNNIEQSFRPRDEFDVDVHPESLRGKVLAYYDALAALPWWLRVLARVMAWRPFR